MVCCCVPFCCHRDEQKKCQFYRFPTNKQLRNKWLELIRRNVLTTSSRVCSCHFLDGCKENLPTIFEWNSNRKFNFKSPENNKRTPRKKKIETSQCGYVHALFDNNTQSLPTIPTVTHGLPDLQSPVAEAIPSMESILSVTESSNSDRGCCSNETVLASCNKVPKKLFCGSSTPLPISSDLSYKKEPRAVLLEKSFDFDLNPLHEIQNIISKPLPTSVKVQNITQVQSLASVEIQNGTPLPVPVENWSFSKLNSNTVPKATQTEVDVVACYTQTEVNFAACSTQTEVHVATCSTQTEVDVACGTQTEKNFTTSSSQTEHEFSPAFYEAQLYLKEIEIERLQKAIESKNCEPFCVFKEIDDASCLHYTGLKLEAFIKLREIIVCAKWTYKGSNVSMLSVDDQLFLTLMKLRHNPTLIDLSHRFKCSVATVSKVFHAIISVLHGVVFETFMNKLPSAAKNNLSRPKCFETFHNCRVILDCTEISCQVPKNMELQRLTFSSYKHRNTFKVLIGISPNGTVVFCSKPFPGSISDRDIVLQSGLLELLQSGDLILADKGFRISDILPQGVSLNVPPFRMNKQFTKAEVHETKRIASARVHVERIMQRLKLYKILNCIPASSFSSITKIVQVCALLINFQSPILNEVKDSFVNSTPLDITV